jgi:hypothetical protein
VALVLRKETTPSLSDVKVPDGSHDLGIFHERIHIPGVGKGCPRTPDLRPYAGRSESGLNLSSADLDPLVHDGVADGSCCHERRRWGED